MTNDIHNNDWTDDLRRRLQDARADVPSDLWAAIESRVDEAEKQRRTHRTVVLRWWSAAAGVVVLVGIAAFMALHGGGARNLGTSSLGGNTLASAAHHASSAAESASPAETNALLQKEKEAWMASSQRGTGLIASADVKHDVPALSTDSHTDVISENVNLTSENTNSLQSNQSFNSENSSAPQNTNDKKSLQSNNYSNSSKSNSKSAMLLHEEKPRGQRSAQSASSGWHVGVGTSGALGNYDQTSAVQPVVASDAAPNDAAMMLRATAYQASNYQESAHHSMPVSVGVSAAYGLSKRLTLSTGVVYTRASSTFERGNTRSVATESQTLHYIGVPVNASYTLWGNRTVRTYVQAGGQADFNVAAKVKTESSSRNTERDRVQFSAGGAVGAQVNVLPQLGVYVEPGVRYYFDNNSNTQTYFKEHPCNFNLQIGLRYNIK